MCSSLDNPGKAVALGGNVRDEWGSYSIVYFDFDDIPDEKVISDILKANGAEFEFKE